MVPLCHAVARGASLVPKGEGLILHGLTHLSCKVCVQCCRIRMGSISCSLLHWYRLTVRGSRQQRIRPRICNAFETGSQKSTGLILFVRCLVQWFTPMRIACKTLPFGFGSISHSLCTRANNYTKEAMTPTVRPRHTGVMRRAPVIFTYLH